MYYSNIPYELPCESNLICSCCEVSHTRCFSVLRHFIWRHIFLPQALSRHNYTPTALVTSCYRGTSTKQKHLGRLTLFNDFLSTCVVRNYIWPTSDLLWEASHLQRKHREFMLQGKVCQFLKWWILCFCIWPFRCTEHKEDGWLAEAFIPSKGECVPREQYIRVGCFALWLIFFFFQLRNTLVSSVQFKFLFSFW